MSNSWTELVNSVVQSDTLKTGVNILNELVQGVTKLTSSLGSLGTIGLGAGIFAGIKNIGIFRTITDEVTGATKSIGLFGKSSAELKNVLNSIKTNGIFKTSTLSESDIKIIEKYNDLINTGVTDQVKLEQATKGASSATAQMIKNANGNTIALNQLTLGAKAAAVAMKVLSVAGNMIVFTLITKGIELATTAID